MNEYHTLKRIFYPSTLELNSNILITGDKFGQLTKVLRTKVGDFIRVFNEASGEWLAEVSFIHKNDLEAIIKKQLRTCYNNAEICLMFSPLKTEKMHFLIEKSVELGISKFFPIITERSIVREINTTKINQYIIQAAEQCECLSIPKLIPIQKLQLAVNNSNGHIIFCNEHEKHLSLKAALAKQDLTSPINILIGPEGGFTSNERDYLLQNSNVHSVHIGPQILRAETAALFAISCAQFATANSSTPPRTEITK